MLHAELTCQRFNRATGIEGQCVWPLVDFAFENLAAILAIPGTFVLTRRRNDRVSGRTTFGIGNLLLLQTMLKFWQRRQPFARVWLEILKSDPELEQEWSLHLWNAEENDLARPAGFDQSEPQACHGDALLDLEAPPAPIEHPDPAAVPNLSRSGPGREERLILTNEDIERLVGNLGQENTLW